MILLSVKARRLLDSAVGCLPDGRQRQQWNAWSQTNLKTRHRDDPEDDGRGPIPNYYAGIASDALLRMASNLENEIKRFPHQEDEIVQLDNNRAYVLAIKDAIIRSSD